MAKVTIATELATGVIKQAARDYQRALCGLGFNGHSPYGVIEECNKFFRESEWMSLLPDLDGDYLMKKLMDECRKCGYNWDRVKELHEAEKDDYDD